MDGRGTLLERRPHALRCAAGQDGLLQRPRGRADNYKRPCSAVKGRAVNERKRVYEQLARAACVVSDGEKGLRRAGDL